jgi:hypothetical protein
VSNYRDPKVTTTENKSSAGKWIGIAIAVILALLLLAWLLGSFDGTETDTVPVVTEEPAAVTPEPDAVVVPEAQ